MVETRDPHRLSPVSVDSSARIGVGFGGDVTSTGFRSAPHLELVAAEGTRPLPLPGEPDGMTALWPSPGEARSAIVMRGWFVQSLLLETIVRDEVGEAAAAHDALERALELAEPDRVLSPFLVDPIPELLEGHGRRPTAYRDLISEILALLAGLKTPSPGPARQALREPLTESEGRILRLLATDLSKREIANELYVSVNTVKTHVKHLYAKLDVQTRHQAVEHARILGLLTYSSR